jgi:hypothetical protein
MHPSIKLEAGEAKKRWSRTVARKAQTAVERVNALEILEREALRQGKITAVQKEARKHGHIWTGVGNTFAPLARKVSRMDGWYTSKKGEKRERKIREAGLKPPAIRDEAKREIELVSPSGKVLGDQLAAVPTQPKPDAPSPVVPSPPEDRGRERRPGRRQRLDPASLQAKAISDRRAIVEDLMHVLHVAVVACLGKEPLLPRSQCPALLAFKSWLSTVALLTGPNQAVSHFKEFATECRFRAISGGAVANSRLRRVFESRPLRRIGEALRATDRTQDQKDLLVQLSYIGRALPKGRPSREGMIAQEAHLEALSSTAPPLPEGRREQLRAFTRVWANAFLERFKPTEELDPTSGACLENSRKKGGMAEFLRQRMHFAFKRHFRPELISPELQAARLTDWERKWPEIQAIFILRGQADGLPITSEAQVHVDRLLKSGYPDNRGKMDFLSSIRGVKKFTGYPVVDDGLAREAHALLNAQLVLDFDEMLQQGPPHAQVLTIQERGFKTRIVTKSPGCLVALGHHLRRWMAAGLRKDHSIREVLAGDHREAVESLFYRSGRDGPLKPVKPNDPSRRDQTDEFVLSADLKSATDLIGSETYLAIVEGILESDHGKTLPPWARRVLLTATGPQLLEYPDLGKHCVSRRGALMGLPTTWPLLCLANLAWWNLAKRLSRLPMAVPRVRICGDDLVAAGPEDYIRAYELAATDSGAVFSNRAKHMVLKGGGVFTEEVFFVELKKVQPHGPHLPSRVTSKTTGATVVYHDVEPAPHTVLQLKCWSQAFPLRGILGTMRTDLTGTEAPYWAAIGPALEGMMVHRVHQARVKLLRTFHAAHPEFRAFAVRMGMHGLIHVPRVFGGFGIPRPELWDTPLPVGEDGVLRLVAVAAKALSLGSSWGSDLTVLSRPWDDTSHELPLRTVASNLAEYAMDQRYLVSKKQGVQVPAGSIAYPGTVSDLADRLVGNIARDLFYLSDAPLAESERFHRNSAETARKLRGRLGNARRAVIATAGGWLLRAMRERERNLRRLDGTPDDGACELPREGPPMGSPPRAGMAVAIEPTPKAPRAQQKAVDVRREGGFLGAEFLGALQILEEAISDEVLASKAETGTAAINLVKNPHRNLPDSVRPLVKSVEGVRQKPITWQRLLDRLAEIETSRIALLLPPGVSLSALNRATADGRQGATDDRTLKRVDVSVVLSEMPDILAGDPRVPQREWSGRSTKKVFYHLFGPQAAEILREAGSAAGPRQKDLPLPG